MKTVVALHTSAALLERIKALWVKYAIPGKLVNIIDDSLIWEVIDNDGAIVETRQRLLHYAKAAEALHADYILNTCSSVGLVSDMIQPFCSIPIIKIDLPMARTAAGLVDVGGVIGVLATLPTTLPPTASLVEAELRNAGKVAKVERYLATGAFLKLMAGQRAEHDAIVISKAIEVAKCVDVLVLAQGSMALLEAEIAKLTGKVVLSSPESGIEQFLQILK
jgi:hypothetical protein